MPKALKNIIILKLILILSFISLASNANNWQIIAPGIEYQDINQNNIVNLNHIHVFRIDLQYNKFRLGLAKNLHEESSFVDVYAKKYNSIIAINGGFFDKSFRPLGLRISDNHQFNTLKYISWWGVFTINNNKPKITNARDFNKNLNVNFAVQSGPRLIISGVIPKLKPGYAERTALGITSDDKVIILVTQNNPMSTTSLAKLMSSPPLSCANALNLDGGSSSQIFVNAPNFKLNVSGFAEISDAILVSPKSK